MQIAIIGGGIGGLAPPPVVEDQRLAARAAGVVAEGATGHAVPDEFIAMGDWTLYSSALKDLEKVTPADVQRVAGKYFTAEQSTVGWFVPESSK